MGQEWNGAKGTALIRRERWEGKAPVLPYASRARSSLFPLLRQPLQRRLVNDLVAALEDRDARGA